MRSSSLKYLTFFCLLVCSCTNEEFQESGDFFYLESKESIMPVWVKGNQASETFIIMLHGGPEGGSSQYYTIFPSHKRIEEEFAIVYWDQRMCGMSQGNPSMKDATLEQFTNDLDQLITLVNHKYNDPQIFLMGHSWGGALGTNYLLEHQERVKGWIEVDGGHSWTKANAISREATIAFADKKLQAKEDESFWQFALDWYDKNPIVGINDNAHYSFVGAANGYDFNPESDSLQIPFSDLIFSSPISTAYFFSPYQFGFLDEGLDLSNRLSEITTPTLLCWGRYDGVFPVELAQETYNLLGTGDDKKVLKIFEHSAHSPNYEEPTLFAETVIDFVYQQR